MLYRTEKNATPWSKDKLRSLLEGLVMEDGKCKLNENLVEFGKAGYTVV